MKQPGKITPPKWAQQLLEWYCRPELLEDLQGDLNEYFDRNLKARGARRARFIYILDVLKFFRLYTVRKPEFINLLIQWIMLGSYIKTSGRSIVRHKLFSAINIIGLAISMSVGLLMIAMLHDVLSYDKFHENHDRIYRVIGRYEYNGNKDSDFFATTSLKAAKAIKESVAGPEDVAILHREFSGDVMAGEKKIPLSGYWANESLFNVFSFQMLQGNPATSLKEPFSVVLTEKSALKLFGESNVVDKTIILKDREYTITGVMEDVPVFSHMKFDMLCALSTRTVTEAENDRELAWDNMWNTWAYVLMPKNADPTALKQRLDKLSEKEDKTVKHTHIELVLQPLGNIMIGEDYGNQIGQVIGSTILSIFGGLCIVVILSACFNYTNLSIARSLRRSREVGIRKTIGALKSHITSQFITESVIIALLSLVLAFGLFILIKPHFINLENDLRSILVLDLTPQLVILFILFAVVVGVSAGFLPALFFARYNPVQVLKSLSSIPMMKGIALRKVLIVFQYCISIIAITATLILYKQYKHFVAYDLGFATENILNIRLQGNKADLLMKELEELPEVKAISKSLIVTSIGNYWGTTLKNPLIPHDSADVYYNAIDENYLPLHAHTLLAGQNFVSKTGDFEESEVIVNQQVLKRFDIAGQDPAKAIGEIVKVDGKDLRIIGVVKDFEYGKVINRTNREVIFRYLNEQPHYLNVNVLSGDWLDTHAKLETIWKKLDPVHPLEAKFYDQQIEEAFSGFKAAMKVGGFLAFLIIGIASIGLLGMVVFTSETRLKEISIRKVLGASERMLLLLLSKGFLSLLAIAAGIALPATYLFFENILLPDLTNHAPLGMTELLLGVLVVMIVALIMIGSQTIKVARSNPADVLKNE